MPNWCNNYITIIGEYENMKPIYDFFKENENSTDPDCLVMNNLVPHDEEYQRIKDNGDFIINPQDKFYGTKWDISIMEANIHSINEDCITLAPSTAWSPPTAFCKKLSKKYGVKVRIEFEEPGIGFVGVEEYDNGEIIEELIYNDYLVGIYELQRDTFWDTIQDNLEYYKIEEELSFESVRERLLSFVTNEDDVKELEKIYNEIG